MSFSLKGLTVTGRVSGFVPPASPGNWAGVYAPSGSRYVAAPTSSVFAFGTGDFTAECYVYATASNQTAGVISLRNNAGSIFNNMFALINGTLSFSDGSSWTSGSSSLPINQWVHAALVRSSGTLKIYQAGTSILSISYTTLLGGNRPCVIGNLDTYDYPIAGSISNARVTNTAVYTTDFTPSIVPLTAIAGTQLLTLQNSTIIDNSTNAFTLTTAGVTMTETGPF